MKVVIRLVCFLAYTDLGSVASYSHARSPSLLMQRFQALATINQILLKTGTSSFETSHSRRQSLDVEEGKDDMSSCPTNADSEHALRQVSIFKSMPIDNQSCISDQASATEMLTEYPSSETQVVFPNFFWIYMVLVTASYINCILALLMNYVFENAHLMGINFGSCLCFGWRLYFFWTWTWTCMWNSSNITKMLVHTSFINDYKGSANFFYLSCMYFLFKCMHAGVMNLWISEELSRYLSFPVS